MIKSIRDAVSQEEGQALVIGALMMLLLAFGILVTLNIGRAVEEKVRLQNSADASAYSMAILEAQSFNFIAFTNRVQASHYNSIMLVHTMANFLVFIEGMLGTMVDFIWTFATILNALSMILMIVFGIGAALQPLVKVLNAAGKFLYKMTLILRKGLYGTKENGEVRTGIISLLGRLKQGMWYVNYAQYISSFIYSSMVAVKLAGGMKKIKENNLGDSGDVVTGSGGENTGAFDSILQIANAGLNIIEYVSVFDKTAGGMPFIPSLITKSNTTKLRDLKPKWKQNTKYDVMKNRGKEIRANQRIMAEIANGTRRERDGSWAHKLFMNNTRTGFNFPGDMGLGMLGSLIGRVININVGGQTKAVSYIPEPKNLEWPANDWSGLSVRRLLDEESLNSSNAVATPDEHRYYKVKSGKDDGIDKANYRKDGSKAIVGMRRPVGDVIGSHYSFDFWLGLDVPVFGKFTLANVTLTPALVSDRNGGRVYRWKVPPEWMVKSIGTPIQAYLRVPISAWDLIGPFKTVIVMCLYGIFPMSGRGCKKSCKDLIWKVIRCKSFPKGCCKLRKKLIRARIPTFEKVKHSNSGSKQKLNNFFMGMGPYMKFIPQSLKKKDMGQPSTWALVNRAPESFMDGNPWSFDDSNYTVNFAPAGEKGKLTLNPKIDDKDEFNESRPLFIFGAGLNAVSRARVYYHRPNNWSEPPNFFNPFWRAQLAPIAERLLPYLKTFQEKINKVLGPVTNALKGVSTGLSFIDNLLGNFTKVLESLQKDGIAKIMIGLIAH